MGFLEHINVGSALIQFAVLLFSLSIHEASHAWVADWFGDYTARYQGRVSLNPMAHIDPIGTLLFPLLQLFAGFPLIGWAKPVPLNTAHLRNPRRDQVFVSLAGPASNLIAAGSSFVLLALMEAFSPDARGLILNMTQTLQIPRQGTVLAPLLGVLFFIFIINLTLALFNVIPIPPLDGHWLLYALLPHDAARAFGRVGSYGIVLIYLLMFLGMLEFVFLPAEWLLGFLV